MRNIRPPIFKGCATALATPFSDGKIDFVAFKKMIERQIEGGVSALVICGTTGEASTMSIDEHLSCIDFALSIANNRVPIIAGSGSNCTKKAIHLSKEASKLGCDALLVVTPYYNKASDEGLVSHFTSIADESECPIMLYNVPSRTGVSIPLNVYEKLSDHDNIIGVKEASGNIASISKLISSVGDKLQVYSGNDDQILPILSIGGLGVVSVVSNIVPDVTQKICDYYFSNDTKSAQKLQIELNPLINALFCEVNPIPLKYALERLNICSGELRLPLCEASKKVKEQIDLALSGLGLV